MKNPPVATELASFISNLEWSAVPTDARSTVERCFVDTIGVSLAGSIDGAGAIAFDIASATASRPSGAPLFCAGTTVSQTEAAFSNATAGHTLDFDDYTMAIPSHPSVTMIPAMLAVTPTREVHGRDLVTGYVAGFETQYYLGSMIKPSHYNVGWHATSTLGAFGATAATCSVLDLSETQTQVALNMAASMASGVRQNFGSMVKPIHAGIAARAGVTAALYAESGATAASDAIAGEHGFLELYGGTAAPEWSARPALGERWALIEDGVIFKKYAACGAIHTAAAAVETLRTNREITPGDIRQVTVRGSRRLPEILRFSVPDTPEEAKFSIDYPIASVLIRGSAGLDEFEPEAVRDPEVQSLCEKVVFDPDESLDYNAAKATVTIETKDGRVHRETQQVRPGSPADPLSDSELRQKFESCAGRVLEAQSVENVYEVLRSLDSVDADEINDVLAVRT